MEHINPSVVRAIRNDRLQAAETARLVAANRPRTRDRIAARLRLGPGLGPEAARGDRRPAIDSVGVARS